MQTKKTFCYKRIIRYIRLGYNGSSLNQICPVTILLQGPMWETGHRRRKDIWQPKSSQLVFQCLLCDRKILVDFQLTILVLRISSPSDITISAICLYWNSKCMSLIVLRNLNVWQIDYWLRNIYSWKYKLMGHSRISSTQILN